MNLNIVTWNATGIMSSSSYLCDIMKDYDIDICGIAEHWLYEKDLHFLNCIDNAYNSYAIADFNLLVPSNRKVGKGGVGILWKRKLNDLISPISIEDDRIIGVKLQLRADYIIYIFQVYIPCANHGTEVFKSYVDKIENLFFSYSDQGTVIVMGDFNAELKCNTPRNRYFTETINRSNVISLNCKLLGDTCTNYGYNSTLGTTIDHMLVQIEKSYLFSNCIIPDDNALNVSSHCPIICTLNTQLGPLQSNQANSCYINWSKVTQDQINNYTSYISNHIGNTNYLNESIIYTDQIDNLYKFVVALTNEANSACFPIAKFKPYIKPYWDDELKHACYLSREMRRKWVLDGKPRGSDKVSFTAYKNAKRVYRKIHRKKASNYLMTLHEEIDNYADLDSKMFWKCINRRKSKSRSSVGNEIIFNDIIYRDQKQINRQWAQYFQDLYSPSINVDFDERFRLQTTSDLNNIMRDISSSQFDISSTTVSVKEVKQACDRTKRNKACGPDKCFYENFKFGGEIMHLLCAKLFSGMLKLSYCPQDMKKGNIIVLHKGGNKPHNEPNNYRAITLSSVVLKLYESVILARMDDCNMYELNDLQGGFRKGMGCLMTSFLLRESNSYVCENNSKLYSCFLDVKKAFDCVWHDALMVKLYNLNIDLYLYKAIYNLYQGMESRVKSNGNTSDWFPVLQGTRQGGILSPKLYLIFANDLLNKLEFCPLGLSLYGLNCSCPSSADDMVLLSLSKNGLQEMMNICYEYGIKFRYTYNAKKSAVIVTNEKSKNARQWYLGKEPVDECSSYTHLGILFDENDDLCQTVKESSSKLRKTFYSIINCGIYENGIHPLSALKLYRAIVLPKALYGCELWSNLNRDHISTLEIAHKSCLKTIQGIPKFSRSDIVLQTLGVLSIEEEIDKKKLIFFGQLCRLEIKHIVKQLFIYRLYNYLNNSSTATGFLPDIHRICAKYNLISIFDSYLNTGIFPSKMAWKTILNNNVKLKHIEMSKNRILSDNRLIDFNIIEPISNLQPCYLWASSKSNRNRYRQSYATVKFMHLLFAKPFLRNCKKCHVLTEEMAVHLAFYCKTLENARNKLWEDIYCAFGEKLFFELSTFTPRLQLIHLLSGLRHFHNFALNPICVDIVSTFCYTLLKR